MHHTTKSKQAAILSSENNQSRLVPFPNNGIVSIDPFARLPSPHARLLAVLRQANPDVQIAAIMDYLYEPIFGMTDKQLRRALNLPEGVSTRKGLRRYSPAGYAYLCWAELVLARGIENDMRDEGYAPGCMPTHKIAERAITLFNNFHQHTQILSKWMEIDLATGQSIPVEDDDNPF
jgi:hypothetical protein